MENIKKAAFAGGCFWCMVKPFKELRGVIEIVSGYTGGTKENPTYEDITSQTTDHYEAVEITYDESKTEYRELVDVFFKNIDPTDPWGQFHDRGKSYRTAIFYHDENQRKIASDYIDELNNIRRFNNPVATALIPASVFYAAEEYHQDYYLKNPLRYKMYYKGSGREAFIEKNWSKSLYDKDELKKRLTPVQYRVTQENGTEHPFENEYNDHFEEGIYVDIISGDPLFSSRDKFRCSCGWPAFSRPIKDSCIREIEDFSHGMIRTEVRSTGSDSHLGHVFNDGPRELGGLRYCINSAALRFVPKDRLQEEGYGDYIHS